MIPPMGGALRWQGVFRKDVAREAHRWVKSLLASRLRPLSNEETHPFNNRSLHTHNAFRKGGAMYAIAAASPVAAIRPSQQKAHAVGVRACRLLPTTALAAPSWPAVAGAPRSSTPHPPVPATWFVRHAAAPRRVLPARAPPRGPRRLMTPRCARAMTIPRGCTTRAAQHSSLLAGDRQILAREGGCIRQGLTPVLMTEPGLAPVFLYFGMRPTRRLSLPRYAPYLGQGILFRLYFSYAFVLLLRRRPCPAPSRLARHRNVGVPLES